MGHRGEGPRGGHDPYPTDWQVSLGVIIYLQTSKRATHLGSLSKRAVSKLFNLHLLLLVLENVFTPPLWDAVVVKSYSTKERRASYVPSSRELLTAHLLTFIS